MINTLASSTDVDQHTCILKQGVNFDTSPGSLNEDRFFLERETSTPKAVHLREERAAGFLNLSQRSLSNEVQLVNLINFHVVADIAGLDSNSSVI